MRILVTGATGFVGRQLVADLVNSGAKVRAVLRRPGAMAETAAIETVLIPTIGRNTEWSGTLEGVDAVVHLAAQVHDTSRAGWAAFTLHEEVNAHGTARLASEAARSGVRRFVFVSSIKAMGEATTERPYVATDTPAPEDAYGRSKLEGERLLLRIAASSSLEPVIVRPPLVYGPGVKANFLAMLRWVDRGWPLPLGAVRSRRSMINVWNLSDLLLKCIHHPGAAGQILLASDGEDLTIPELLHSIARSMDRSLRLVNVPSAVLEMGATALGLGRQIRRLVRSLQLDAGSTFSRLDWRPPVGCQEGLQRTVDCYQTQRPSA